MSGGKNMSISQNVMTENTMSNPSAFETLRKAADRYVNSGKPLSITAHSMCKSISKSIVMSRLEIESYNPLNRSIGPYIIDIRDVDTEMPDAYFLGHIPGAVHIPWRKLTKLKTLNSLPKDRQIVVYSSTGQTGGQAAAILSLLGFDAVNLKWGITSWTDDVSAAPARYSPERDILWQNESYRSTVTDNLEPDIRYDMPEIAVEGRTPESIIWSAADEYLRQYKIENISAGSLYDPLFAILHPLYVSPYEEPDKDMLVLPFGVQPGENDESFTWPFILDVRTEAEYTQGHIPACVHIPFTEVFTVSNMRKLPPDRQIVVVSNTGHTSAHVAALLNLLGYDAVNLKWGMSGWCSPEKLNITDSYSIDRDCMKYPVVKGWNPGKAAECKG
jgi:rhodanese-related sulfurtransferase